MKSRSEKTTKMVPRHLETLLMAAIYTAGQPLMDYLILENFYGFACESLILSKEFISL